MTFNLPKFGLDPPEWKEVQRLRQAGLPEQADAVEAHFKSGDPLPKVSYYSSGEGGHTTIDGEQFDYYEIQAHPLRHLVQWMIETRQVDYSLGL